MLFRSNFTGLEANIRLLGENLLGTASPFESVQLKYSWLTSDTASNGFESNYVLDYLRNKVTLVLIQKLSKQISLSWSVNWQDRNGGYFQPGASEETLYPSFFTADLRLMHRSPKSSVFIDISNLFNKSYVDLGNVEQPGRWLKAGVTFAIGK